MNFKISSVSDKKLSYSQDKNISFGYSFFLKDFTLPCAYCGGKMLSIRNIRNMADLLEQRTGNNAVSLIHNHYNFLDKKQQIVVDVLCQEIKKNPKSPVKKVVEKLANRFERVTNVQYSDAVTNAFTNSKIDANSPFGKRLADIIEISKKSLLSNVTNSQQKTLRITELHKNLIDLIHSLTDEKEKVKIRQFMQSIDNDFDYIKQDPHTFFAKFGYEPMRSFLSSLFAPIRSTADHIVTASRNGASESANYLAVCGMCNWARSEQPFKNFVSSRPRIQGNIKKQFMLLDKMISPKFAHKHHISLNFKDNICNYLSQVQKTIQEQMGKPLDIELPNFTEHLQKMSK